MSRVKAEYFNACERMNWNREDGSLAWHFHEQQAREGLLSKIDAMEDKLSALRSSIEYEIDEAVLEGVSVNV